MEALLISACLMGFNCKYNGGNNALPEQELETLKQHYRLIPVCPELAGGLPTPRVPSERQGERVITRDGRDVTEAFQKGAEIAAALVKKYHIRRALLKSNSPSCGSGTVYDGSFSGILIRGDGVTAEYLKQLDVEISGRVQDIICMKVDNPSTFLINPCLTT